VQYASIAYRQRLADRDITISMSRSGNPFDNAKAESFMKTLKAKEINGKLSSTSTTPIAASTASSLRSTTRSACIRRLDTDHPLSSKPHSRKTKRGNVS
jgi:transposase InsO family protein